jgi:hypothetical protein
MGFKAFAAVNIEILNFWIMSPCKLCWWLSGGYQRFGGNRRVLMLPCSSVYLSHSCHRWELTVGGIVVNFIFLFFFILLLFYNLLNIHK